MLLTVDDAEAAVFNVPDASVLDGQRVTVTDQHGLAHGRATLQAISAHAVRLGECDTFPADERYRIRDTAAVRGTAVRMRSAEERPEQAAFRERVGEACGWACVITGEAVREVLDAAHLPGSSWRGGDNAGSGGVLLRTDL